MINRDIVIIFQTGRGHPATAGHEQERPRAASEALNLTNGTARTGLFASKAIERLFWTARSSFCNSGLMRRLTTVTRRRKLFPVVVRQSKLYARPQPAIVWPRSGDNREIRKRHDIRPTTVSEAVYSVWTCVGKREGRLGATNTTV